MAEENWQPIKTCDQWVALVTRTEKRVHKTLASLPHLAMQGAKLIDFDDPDSQVAYDGKWTDINGEPLNFRPTHWMPAREAPSQS